MRKIFVLALCFICFLCLSPGQVFSQEADDKNINASRGSIPEDLLRPRRDESPRYAVDTVIGTLGQGTATVDAYQFARKVAEDLLQGNKAGESLKAMASESRDSYISILGEIGPRSFRLGGGRVENDGSVSFLVRYIGRELAITGELYIRAEEATGSTSRPAQAHWFFEDLILEDAQNRKEELEKSELRFDFSPYHRFY